MLPVTLENASCYPVTVVSGEVHESALWVLHL